MKLFTPETVREWDAVTIREQGISSWELMEVAAQACVRWMNEHISRDKKIYVFCGPGNNGGDGLAIAAMLLAEGRTVAVYAMESSSSDNKRNREALEKRTTLHPVHEHHALPEIRPGDVVVDALFGIGMNKSLTGYIYEVVKHINASGATIISIDVPSGLRSDISITQNAITATHTLSFQTYKPGFFLPGNHRFTGKLWIININLSARFAAEHDAKFHLTEDADMQPLLRDREQDAHKGDFGHAALVGGSKGMCGAAVLAAKGCLNAGVGLLTGFVPDSCYTVLQSAVPAAMCKVAGQTSVTELENMHRFTAVGIGVGLGRYEDTPGWMEMLFQSGIPMVIDADGLNALHDHPHLFKLLPPNTIITPHPGEFSRLFPNSKNQIETAMQESARRQIHIVLKGRHTFIATPEGKAYFNNTGNPGMARGGMGDILTGIITGLLAMGFSCTEAAVMGVYWHGAAGDHSELKSGPVCMQTEDVINAMSAVWIEWKEKLLS